MLATYDIPLVVVSFLVAILASYTALKMTERISFSPRHTARLWLFGGAIAMGIGIWAMHFVGMLAYRLPIDVGYDEPLTILSLLIGIGVSGFALWSVSGAELPLGRLLNGALWMGIGIASMHYTGMSAMSMSPGIEYDTFWFCVSIAIAFLASLLALWLAFRLRKNTPHVKLVRFLASVVMGLGIAGMHYAGMKAANIAEGSICLAVNGVTQEWLAVVVIIITFAVLSIALLTALLEVKFELYSEKMYLANQELRQLVLYDHLTGLPNRSLLADRMSQAILKAKRNKHHLAVLFLDLDGFKKTNDTLGHHTGDLLLIEVAKRLEMTIRAQDTVARLGGDEFIILIDMCTRREAAAIAEKLLEAVDQIYALDEYTVTVTASIGVAYYPDDGQDAHALMVNSDLAMYNAKHQGGNAYTFYEANLPII
jgi:diguanylate cyclase (GGDEF)-like protein